MTQKEYSGLGSIANIKEILEELSPCEKIFLVTGKVSFATSGAEDKLNAFLKKYQATYFNEFSPNSNFKDVCNGLNYFNEDTDVVIAIGGGTVFDIAKSINVLAANKGNMLEYVTGSVKLSQKGKPLIAVSTSTGSGSEATKFSVVYHKGGGGYSMDYPHMLPDYSIVDPELTMSMPYQVAAASSLDAFSQAIESYWSVGATEISRMYSLKAHKLILKNIKDSVNHPSIESRQGMARGAHWTGKAVNISRTTVCHALSYVVITLHGLAHGHAVALTLGGALEFNAAVSSMDCLDKRGSDQVQETINHLLLILGCQTATEGKERVHKIIRDVGLDFSCKNLGFNNKDIQEFTDRVNVERLKNNPRAFIDKGDLKKLYAG